MSLQFGSTPIGAMQYNGVTIGEAMIDGQVVYRSTVTVTPLPPTFLDAAPWLELPTQEGVLYTVDGTAGPGNTVTVTATAESGYELDGQTTWVHTYPRPPYSEYGTFGAHTLARLTWEDVATHTLTADIANATITLDVTLNVSAVFAGWRLRVLVNGQQVAIGSPTELLGDPPPPLSTVADGADGDLVQFQVQGPNTTSSASRRVGSGSWSIVEN